MKYSKKQAGMSPIIVVIIIVAVLAIGAVGWYVFARNSGDSSSNGGNGKEQAAVMEGTFFDAVNQGDPLQCDWELNYDGPAELTRGKFYTDGINGRSEASYEHDGQTYQALAIITEDRTYHWSLPASGDIEGISDQRAAYEAREPKYDTFETSVDVDFNADYIFTCEPWAVDESVFVPPGDMKFLIL